MLSSSEILTYQGQYSIIDPFSFNQLNPNSYNVGLNTYSLIELTLLDSYVDLRKSGEENYNVSFVGGREVLLLPGRAYLGTTIESVNLQCTDLTVDIDGRSTTARNFVQIHKTAGRGDLGFTGWFTLEITVHFPTLIRYGDLIAQLYFTQINCEDVANKYNINSKYSNNCMPVLPKPISFKV